MTLASTLVELDDTRADLIALLDAMTPQQRAFSPSTGAWSAESVAEHLLLTEDRLLNAIVDPPNLDPPVPGAIDDALAFLRSDARAETPPFLEPTERPYRDTRAELILLGARWLEIAHDASRADRAVFDHPLAGPLTLLDTVRFVEAHAGHHRYQLARISTAPGYPS
ncbi:DinB family protein [Rubrivirga sp.]|uniref:DinB family protein n=1 Tax=Rubrivirga sp. TaxID=1885344 RepID=UPI003C762742